MHNVDGIKVTKTGYKHDSPDVNNPANLIPSNHITMRGVDFPVLGIDNLANSMIMLPDRDYVFPGDYVVEYPLKQNKQFLNQTGGISNAGWGAIGAGAQALFGVAGNAIDANIMAKAQKDIAGGAFLNEKTVAGITSQSQEQINAGHDATDIEVAKINAYATMNTPTSKSSGNAVIIGVFALLIVSTIGIFYVGARQGKA